MTDTTPASCFRKKFFKRIQKLIMANDEKIRHVKLQFDINREAEKISALSSRKIDKYKFIKSEEILPSDQSEIIEQASFSYSPLSKAFEKLTKDIEEQGEKRINALEEHEK